MYSLKQILAKAFVPTIVGRQGGPWRKGETVTNKFDVYFV